MLLKLWNRRNIVKTTIANTASHFYLHEVSDDVAETIENMGTK